MRIPKIILGIALLNAICYTANAQELTQVVRGQVIDIESQIPLAFATITVITTDSLLGTITDDNGIFRFKKAPFKYMVFANGKSAHGKRKLWLIL